MYTNTSKIEYILYKIYTAVVKSYLLLLSLIV